MELIVVRSSGCQWYPHDALLKKGFVEFCDSKLKEVVVILSGKLGLSNLKKASTPSQRSER